VYSGVLKLALTLPKSSVEIMVPKDRSKTEYQAALLSIIDDGKTLQKIIDDLL
jgi:hypothetical protein